MMQDYLHLVNVIIREASVRLDNSTDDIHEVTKHIFEKIKTCNPPGLKVVTFAILQLRDIADQNSWARHLFPDAPVYYFDAITDCSHYNNHIDKLKNEFPLAKINCKSPTVVGALCEGDVGIDILEVIISGQTELQNITEKHKRVLVNADLVNLPYASLYEKLNIKIVDKDIVSFVTMLSVLLQKWDVTVVTANNITRGKEFKSGLCGVVLCFERDVDHSGSPFVQNLPAIFAPILQLVTNASLLESARHYHNQSQKLAIILEKKVRPAMEMLENIKWEIQEAIGGCFGDDLEMLVSDLTFKKKDSGSLYALFRVESMSPRDKGNLGESGIWHIPYSDVMLGQFKAWLTCHFPLHYVYLSSDSSFRSYFVDEILKIDNEESWNMLFSSGVSENNSRRLRKLFQVRLGKFLFEPHVDAMENAFTKNFSKCKKSNVAGVLKFEVESDSGITKDMALSYINKAKMIDLSAQFAQIRHHPQTWIRLYKGKVRIDWINAQGQSLASIFFGSINEIPETLDNWVEGSANKICVTYFL